MSVHTTVRWAPLGLTLVRLALAPGVVWVAATSPSRPALFACLLGGLLSDVYDGVLARRLGVATAWLRRLDSTVDVAFYAGVLAAIGVARPTVVRGHVGAIGVLMAMETACVAVSLVRFGRLPATHSYAAKAWGVMLFVCCTGVLCFGVTGALVTATLVGGWVVDAEALAILLVSREAPVDVAGIRRAWRAGV